MKAFYAFLIAFGLGAISPVHAQQVYTQPNVSILGPGCTTAFYSDPMCKPCGVGMKSSGVYPIAPQEGWSGTATVSGTTLTIASYTSGGPLGPGDTITGTGITTGTQIISGTPSNSVGATFTLSTSATVSPAESITAAYAAVGVPAWYTMGDTPDADPLDFTVCTSAQWESKWGWDGIAADDNTAVAKFLVQEKGYSNLAWNGANGWSNPNIWYISTTGSDGTCAVNRPDLPCATPAPIFTALKATGTTFSGTGSVANGSTTLTIASTTSGELGIGTTVTDAGSFIPASTTIKTQLSATTYRMSNAATGNSASESITGTSLKGGAIVVFGGTYSTLDFSMTAVTPNFSLSGSPGYPLYLMAFPGATVQLERGIYETRGNSPTGVISDLTIDGFEFWDPTFDQNSGTPAGGQALDYSDDWRVTVINNEFAGWQQTIFSDDSHNVTVQNNVFHDMHDHAVYYAFSNATACLSLNTFGQDIDFAQDWQNYLNGTSCGASYNGKIIGNIAYSSGIAGFDVFHVNAYMDVALVSGNIVSYSGYPLGIESGVYNGLASGNLFFDDSSKCIILYPYANFSGNATLNGTTSVTINSTIYGTVGSGYPVFGNLIPSGTTLSGTGNPYTLSQAATGSATEIITNGHGAAAPATERWNSVVNNVCWQGNHTDIVQQANPNNDLIIDDLSSVSYVKDTLVTGNTFVTYNENTNGTAPVWFETDSYPETSSFTGNQYWSNGTCTNGAAGNCNIGIVNSGAGATGMGAAPGSYTYNSGTFKWSTYFSGDTAASSNPLPGISESCVYTPGTCSLPSSYVLR